MRARLTRPFVAAFAFLLLVPAPARALTIVSQYVGYISSTEAFEFTITLSAPPDFVTVDEFGRQKDDFQYWITWDLHISNPLYPYGTPDVLVGLSTQAPGSIPVCNNGGNPDPECGSWGSSRGSVPYELNGSTITFAVPREVLGDPDGVFSFVLGVFRFGATTDQITGISSQGPVATVPTTWGRMKVIYR